MVKFKKAIKALYSFRNKGRVINRDYNFLYNNYNSFVICYEEKELLIYYFHENYFSEGVDNCSAFFSLKEKYMVYKLLKYRLGFPYLEKLGKYHNDYLRDLRRQLQKMVKKPFGSVS
jgi:hypothetical protein